MALSPPNFRFSGHETFVCRYAWLPKAIREIDRNPLLFRDEDNAMVSLGVGKNMVRSVCFWAEMAQIITKSQRDQKHEITSFGRELLGRDGHDSYLENSHTLWLLHWKVATNPIAPLFFWHQLLNYWHRAEFTESEIIPFFVKNTPPGSSLRSNSTLEAGYRVFVNSYVATRSSKGEVAEDNLDSPLVELDLVRRVGDRRAGGLGSLETIYSFNLDDKPAITSVLFAYCLHDFWINNFPKEKTLPFHTIAVAPGSPGQIFKLPESAVRRHLDLLKDSTSGAYVFEESASLQLAIRKKATTPSALLEAIYDSEV